MGFFSILTRKASPAYSLKDWDPIPPPSIPDTTLPYPYTRPGPWRIPSVPPSAIASPSLLHRLLPVPPCSPPLMHLPHSQPRPPRPTQCFCPPTRTPSYPGSSARWALPLGPRLLEKIDPS